MDIASYIDHTNLKQDAKSEDIETLCKEAKQFGFAAVCVNSSYVPLCAELLKGTDVKVCTVVGFPLGAMSTKGKAMEARQAILDGASEIDMVVHVGMVKSKAFAYVEQDIREVVQEAKGSGKAVIVKVIIEACLLTEEEKKTVCSICLSAGADFVKTSTGFAKGGAVAEDVALLKSIAGDCMKVKAAGGIKTTETARTMILAGASRIGTSCGVQIALSLKG